MILKTVMLTVMVVFSAFGALALDLPSAAPQMQIFTDLQLADEVESLNDGQAGKVWLRSSEDEDNMPSERSQAELKGFSRVEQ